MTKNQNIPLVVDLDGTLTPTDTLVESVIKVIKQSPVNLLWLPFWLIHGRAGFKEKIAAKSSINVELLPYHELLLDYLRKEKAKGRRIILATAAHQSIAQAVADHIGLFDQVLATERNHNLKGATKLQAIRENVGNSFIYAGDSRADIPIWKAANAAILVNVSQNTGKTVRQHIPIEHQLQGNDSGFTLWFRALRIHQWLKNLLLFVPLLTAFSFFDVSKLISMILAFLAFSLAASATYIGNDIWDLENDRAHPRKQHRPFASGRLSILKGLAASTFLLLVAFTLALMVSSGFTLMLLLYLVLTSIYSLVLKEYMLIDVLMLSLLYTLRILAGSVAIDVSTSSWLLSFSVFIFLSLALVKRCAELVSLEQNGITATRGRDYRVTDLTVLWPLGVGAALSSVVVFGLFINAPETQHLYKTPHLLWLAAIGLIYWLARLWVKTSRGEMHDDPVIYAAKDRGSRITVMCIVAVILAAHFLAVSTPL
ncbi:MAG TPA: UbiA family prenyltransferase [Nitrosomonas europaea]|uniref:UbiA family prenyltransferase n=1 Tax=Nitrosomonas europaea TaxID=915 RepID=UPI00249106F3|nr:UbiA family prenyltransferase [Nitrosomonas europaea]HRN82767.1 UbiA family prenyltransferase [Nitrosomonas europaea]HRO55799.1 UbiA family prenyltransferase [Nitrosomonas europaea]HRQ09224.1 UbiA family prenyltransferase [Nitrosomonas europaea]HUM73527.1 UbiA family prenyltransferase [Nitrosomonas europaea]